jgi:hypothetical protein
LIACAVAFPAKIASIAKPAANTNERLTILIVVLPFC